MKASLLAVAALGLAAPTLFAQASTWTIDPAHSEVDFVVRHMSVSNVHGRFGIQKGTIHYDEADPAKSTVEVTIDAASLDTGVAARDNDVKGANFFDVAQFPTATFTSTSVAKSGSGLTVSGNLTLHGISRPVQLEVEAPSTPAPGMDKKTHSGFSASTTIHRKDFGVGPKYPDNVVSDAVKLNIDIEVVKQ